MTNRLGQSSNLLKSHAEAERFFTAIEGGRGGGRIRPPQIAEIGGTRNEGVGSHRNPDGIGQVGAGFHSTVGRPSNVEPQPVVPGK